jgi:hypothetical protein
MAQLGMHFDPNAVEPNQGFDLLPPGEYRVQITDSDVRSTKNGDGRLIWTEMEILDGEFANRKLWHNFNILNPSEKAQNIGQGQLSSLCHAIGVVGMEDSNELHFKPFTVSVGVQPPKDGYDAQNRIKTFKEASQGSSGIRSARPAQARQGASNGGSGGSGGGSRQKTASGPGTFQGGSRPWAQGAGRGQQGRQEGRRQDPVDDTDIPF